LGACGASAWPAAYEAKRTINPEAEALLAAITGYRTRAAAMGRSIECVIAV
jgi:hypothetical protein